MVAKRITVCDSVYSIPELSDAGYTIGLRKWKKSYDPKHFIIQTVGSNFDKDLFAFPHIPIVICETTNKSKFSRPRDIRVLDMPIKFPGHADYRIPKELEQFDEVLSKIVSFEHDINPAIGFAYYAYLTVDQGYVKANEFHRSPGCHCQGFQGPRISPKRPVARSYIVYNKMPPVFYTQPFDVAHMDDRYQNFFSAFDKQANELAGVRFQPYDIVLYNAYSVLREDKAITDEYRTYLRLTFSTQIYDRLGNTKNPMFPYKWNMVEREIPQYLRKRHPHAV